MSLKSLYQFIFKQSLLDKVTPVIVGLHVCLPNKTSRTKFIKIQFCDCEFCESLKKNFCRNLEIEWMKSLTEEQRMNWLEDTMKQVHHQRMKHCKCFCDFENNDFLHHCSKNFLVFFMTAALACGFMFVSLFHK